jgi:hypothetical protein
MPWDPLGAWPDERRLLWATLACWACFLQGPPFVEALRTSPEKFSDFFQEWASARNAFEGLPIYTNHAVTLERYLGIQVGPSRSLLIEYNAHPPTSVLLALPLAGLNYYDAFFLWNLISLARAGGKPVARPAWAGDTILGMVGLSTGGAFAPEQPAVGAGPAGTTQPDSPALGHGDMVRRAVGAAAPGGVLLGTAAAIKLFPGFLLLYYTIRRRWTIVAAGFVAAATLTAVTAALLGPGAYADYVRDVLPEIEWFRVGWNNASLLGFWSKLFDPAPGRVRL